MKEPAGNYWKLKLDALTGALEKNNFSVFRAETAEEARSVVLDQIIPEVRPQSLSWGGSMTVVSAGLYHGLKDLDGIACIDTNDKKVPTDEMLERRRQALQVDLFVTGTNAVTESGMLVNLDMIGNRVAALTFGPRHVVVCVGRNKIVSDLNDAMFRIKEFAAPVNSMRLDKKNPCVKTGACQDCNGPDRICNVWTITEKSFPKGRIKIVLVNQDMGL